MITYDWERLTEMKIIVQRAKQAKVIVDQKIVGEIDQGVMLLVGMTHDDTIEDLKYCAKKIANLRIFEDEHGKMNRSVKDVEGAILSISQFTLYGNTEKGNRPFIQKLLALKLLRPYMINSMRYCNLSTG